MTNKYHIAIKRNSLEEPEISTTLSFETPLSLKKILEKMLTEESIDGGENTLISLEITNLNNKESK